MSKDFFRVKKGLNIKPTDPTTVTDLEDGDIIIDSTDDNRMKVYDSAGGDFASVGTGGSSGNFLADFEKLTPDLSNVTSVVDTVTFLPIDDNNKSVKATWAASAGYIQYESAVPADVEGQGLMTVWLKTSVEGLTLSTTTDGVVQSTLSVIANNKWKQYEIPYVIEGTEQGFRVEASGSVTGDVFIDEAFVGLAPAGYVSKIATTITDWEDFTPTGSWSTNTTYTGKYRRVGDVAEISVRMLTSGTPDNTTLQINLPDGLVIDTSKLAGTTTFTSPIDGVATIKDASADSYLIKPVYGSTTAINFVTHYDNASGLNNIVHLGVINNTRPMTWANGDYLDVIFQVPIVGWSTDYSTVVTQNTELTAQTANEFSASVNGTTAAVSNENYDFINGSCTKNAAGDYTCNFNSNIFTQNPVINCTAFSSNRVCMVYARSTTSFSVYTRIASGGSIGALADSSFFVNVSKSASDVNKSATIVGKFENINSSELVKVEAAGNDGSTLSGNLIINFTESIDNTSSFDGSDFTAPKDSYYLLSGSVRYFSATTSRTDAYVNNSHVKTIGVETSQSTHNFAGIVKLNKNDVLNLRATTAATLNNSTVLHHLSITELPDTESIVKNLLAESSQTKCQTKYLSGDVTANGTSDNTQPDYIATLDSIEFNNLTVGKRYSVNSYAVMGVNSDSSIVLEINNGSENIVRNIVGNSNGISNITGASVGNFIATNSTLSAKTVGWNNTSQILYGNGTRLETNVTLCQLPDTYVDTDEW